MSQAYMALTVRLDLPELAPTAYSERLAGALLAKIADGDSVPKACKALKISRNAVRAWRVAHPEFAEAYQAACEMRGEAVFEQHGEVIAKTLKGAIEPRAANAALRALEWRAMVLNRTLYGQKQEVQHSGGLTLGINTKWRAPIDSDAERV